MFASWSIKKRVNTTILLLCLASIAAIALLAYQNQMHQLRESLQDLAKNEGRLFQSILVADSEGLARAHTGLDRLDSLLAPFAAGNRDQILANATPIFEDIKKHNNITHMYFIQPDGKVLLRVHKPEQAGDVLKRTTFLQAQASGQVSSGLEMGKNFFSLRCVRPVFYQGKAIGYMEVAEEIDHVFQQMKSITGNDESLFLSGQFLKSQNAEVKGEKVGDFSILYPTKKEVTLRLAAKLVPEMNEALKTPVVKIVSLGTARYVVGMGPTRDATGATVGILFSQKEVSSLFAGLWKDVAVIVGIFILIMTGSLALLYLSLRKSLLLFEKLKEHIVTVTSTWDLTRRLTVDTNDEMGEMAAEFNAMTDKLAEMVRQVNTSSKELARVTGNLKDVSTTVLLAAEQQSISVAEASSAMTQINGSIKGVAQGVESLATSASETSSSVLEMAASVEEVALSTATVANSLNEVGSAITEMAASIRQVGEHADILMESATVNTTSIVEMDSSIKEVEKHAIDTVAISEAMRHDAEIGKQAVESTIAGMLAIKKSSRITSEAIANLSKRAGDIRVILSVIDEVAARTNLLALNAAIIAAQAGEHGKGFAVVAGEIKQLADNTTSSTKEISKVINAVLEETERAVAAINHAEAKIAEGEALGRKSGEALEKIVNSAEIATSQVNSIARATTEQSNGSKMIREATEQVSDMVKQIAASTREQTGGSSMVLTSVEKIRSLTDQVKSSTREQSDTGGFIARSTENITDMIRRIKMACDEQTKGSDQIVPAVRNIEAATSSNLGAVKVLGETIDALSAQIDVLQNEIDRFHVDRQ
ncbi:methyl-accepting chemotaxis protein [Geomonas sp. Red32]|uniref:methyl-accepting chemotaxis protein n=1 Tax=Geomonas sp. Red32 TaxID=2912856 RepID=UPI00202CAB68|nr:methyl-accepting chemotaxis protein [Geomonas sp. Red32]MCM0081278.1 methyl-accepting chemotaxis protein [Geomonas sp. Red32]